MEKLYNIYKEVNEDYKYVDYENAIQKLKLSCNILIFNYIILIIILNNK